MECLFCKSIGPYNSIEHIIPESLGNKDEILIGHVCDSCQNYFGKDFERFVLHKSPVAFWRVYLGNETKKGKLPTVDLSMPSETKGVIPNQSVYNDNRIAFTPHEDLSTSIDIENDEIIRQIISGERKQFQFVLSPKHLIQLGRFFGKIAIELLSRKDPLFARSNTFTDLRKYIRYGIQDEIWPLFHSQVGQFTALKRSRLNNDSLMQESTLYQYELGKFEDYWLFCFLIGTDLWLISMNNPYPTPRIRQAFEKNINLSLIWYSLPQWKKP